MLMGNKVIKQDGINQATVSRPSNFFFFFYPKKQNKINHYHLTFTLKPWHFC